MQDELYVGRAAYGSDTQDSTFQNHFYQTYLRTPADGLWDPLYDYATEDDVFVLDPFGRAEPDAVAIIPQAGETTLDTPTRQGHQLESRLRHELPIDATLTTDEQERVCRMPTIP